MVLQSYGKKKNIILNKIGYQKKSINKSVLVKSGLEFIVDDMMVNVCLHPFNGYL